MELESIIAILAGIEHTPASRFLSFSGPVDSHSLVRLSEALASNVLIRGLRLEGGRLLDTIAYRLLNSPFPPTPLSPRIRTRTRTISMVGINAGCSICDEGAIVLAEALRDTNALDILELPDCGIGAAGAVALATALDESNFNLTSLDVRGKAHYL